MLESRPRVRVELRRVKYDAQRWIESFGAVYLAAVRLWGCVGLVARCLAGVSGSEPLC